MPNLTDVKMNKQNFHIATQNQNLQMALQKLLYKNITVLSVVIEDAKTAITVLDTPHCNKLGNVLVSTIGIGAGRRHLKVAQASGCLVKWESAYSIH